MKRTANNMTIKELRNVNAGIDIKKSAKKVEVVKALNDASVLHPACNNVLRDDVRTELNIILAYAGKATVKKNGGIVIKRGRTSIVEFYVCDDDLVHVYVRDHKAIEKLVKVCKCFHTINEKWVYPDRLEFTRDAFADFVYSDNLHILTDTFK